MAETDPLEGLNASQREAVLYEGGPLCIVAAAGSGKTRVLVNRIAYRVKSIGGTAAKRSLAITFTRAAANEMRYRVSHLLEGESIRTGTFHSMARSTLTRYWSASSTKTPTLLTSKSALLAEIMRRPESGGNSSFTQRIETAEQANLGRLINQLASEIEWSKARRITPHNYPDEAVRHGRKTPFGPSRTGEYFKAYESAKSRRSMVDFDDLIIMATDLMEENPRFVEEERWLYRHFYVDEFQDVNPSQLSLLQAWLGDRDDITVVGDPNQSIYGWNGADPALMLRFPALFENTKVHQLSINYRSTPEILNLAARVLPQITDERFRLEVSASRESQPSRPPRVIPCKNEAEEAKTVVRRLRELHAQNLPYSKMAVLARTNFLLTGIDEALLDANIPHTAPSVTDLYSRKEIRLLLSELGALGSNCSITQVCDTLEAAQIFLEDPEVGSDNVLRRLLKKPSDTLADSIDILRIAASRARRENPELTLLGLSEAIEAGELSNTQSADSVTLTTFHGAKGLEWYHVHLVGVEDGYVPISQANSEDQLDEERRLLYVAMTRASTSLTVSWSRLRKSRNISLKRDKSPFLAQAMSSPQDDPDSRSTASSSMAQNSPSDTTFNRAQHPVRSHLSAQRQGLRDDSKEEEKAVLQELRLWRQRVSRATCMPAHLVMADHLLIKIAVARPTSIEELALVRGFPQLRNPTHQEGILKAVVLGLERTPS